MLFMMIKTHTEQHFIDYYNFQAAITPIKVNGI